MGITGNIYGINGPVITIQGNLGYKMNEMVYVGEHRLVGEVIRLSKEKTTIQVYEETSGLGPGEPVESMDVPLSVELGPGLLTSIYDGIQRPLDDIMKETGRNNLKRGVEVPSLKRDKKWQFVPTVKAGDSLWRIAAQQLGNGARYKEIKTMNGLKNNTIHAGQVLKLPN